MIMFLILILIRQLFSSSGRDVIKVLDKIRGVARILIRTLLYRDGRFGSKVGQIGPKWEKSGASKNVLKSDLKKPRICPILG